VLKLLSINDIDLIELNEAFASQALAVTRELNLNPDIINVNGGAIALGTSTRCTGAKLSVQLFDEMKRRGSKYGIVSMLYWTRKCWCLRIVINNLKFLLCYLTRRNLKYGTGIS
jgi:acetyl-CoA acetyltransferase